MAGIDKKATADKVFERRNGQIIKTEKIETVINIDAMRVRKEELETYILNFPQKKTKPDQETLEYFNDFVDRQNMIKLDLQKELDQLGKDIADLERL